MPLDPLHDPAEIHLRDRAPAEDAVQEALAGANWFGEAA